MRVPRALLLGCLVVIGPLAGCMGGDESSTDPSASRTPVRLGGAASVAVPACAYKFDGQYSQTCATGILKETPFVHVHIPSKLDGADIEIGYWLPDVPEGTKVPVIVQASPYYGNLGVAMEKKSGYLLMLISNYVQHGYAVAGISVRGTGDSGGCMDLMGKKEVADLDQAITWLGEQPWSSGAIGMTGLSYDGSTPWSAASTGNKYVKTIVPISGVPDVYGLMFRNGSAESRGPFLLNALYYAFFARVALAVPPDTTLYTKPNFAAHTLQGIVCPESWTGLAVSAYSGTYGERDPLGWWAERNRKPNVEKNFQGSIFSIQGLQDWNVDPMMVIPWVDQMNQTGKFTHQMLGQWGHSFPDTNKGGGGKAQRWDWAEILLHWFDYWLKGETTVDLGPAVQVQDQTGRWHAEERFPPADANWTTFHLNTGNKLGFEPGPAGSQVLSPSPLLATCVGPTVCTTEMVRSLPGYSADFSTGPLEKDMLLSGLPRLHVTVSPKGPTGHLAGWLYDVDGSTMTQVGRTQINLLYADGTEKAKPISPNTPIIAKMEFQPLDVYIPAGHRLMLRVWESSDTDRLPAIPPEPVELLWGGSTKSVLELPLIERTSEAYFAPPKPA